MFRWTWIADTHFPEFIPARNAPIAAPPGGYPLSPIASQRLMSDRSTSHIELAVAH